ncbi:phosphodiesterase, MJ0936 family protein [Candida albicans]|uniref:Vacuolar protein sorting-associated protein 29 n=1 Tax=Candida albicans TaxID=5476 RepID=A0A8H6F3M5_CANAX|nr:phosphodiesterase, MJ0936 family protein [Candida albicans]
MLTLAIGDLFVPERAVDLPSNITNSSTILQFLTNISPQFNLVKGEFDNPVVLSQQFVHDNLKIGYTNGFQVIPRGDPLALSAFARELDVDVLIWGGTHKVEAYTLDGKFFINPGSATGAFNFDWPENDEEEREEADKSQDDDEATDKESHDTEEAEPKVENETSTERDKLEYPFILLT